MRKICLVLLMLSIVFSCIIGPSMFTVVKAADETVVITPHDDTYVYSATSTTGYNYGGSLALNMRYASYTSNIYLKWQLTDSNGKRIDTSKIVSAKMKLNLYTQTSGYTQRIGAFPVDDTSWKEGSNKATEPSDYGITWNDAPTITATEPISTVPVGNGGTGPDDKNADLGWKEWDLTSYLKNYSNEYASVALIGLDKVEVTEVKSFYSKESTISPYIEIILSDFDISNVILSDSSVKSSSTITGISITKNDELATGNKYIISAIYDSNNKLLGVKMSAVNVTNLIIGTNNIPLSIDLTAYTARSKIKVFMFDSMLNMKPLSLTKTLQDTI